VLIIVLNLLLLTSNQCHSRSSIKRAACPTKRCTWWISTTAFYDHHQSHWSLLATTSTYDEMTWDVTYHICCCCCCCCWWWWWWFYRCCCWRTCDDCHRYSFNVIILLLTEKLTITRVFVSFSVWQPGSISSGLTHTLRTTSFAMCVLLRHYYLTIRNTPMTEHSDVADEVK